METTVVDGEVLPISARAYARRWKTLGVLSLALLIIGLDNTILNVALPSLQEHFNASSSTLQWMVDAYMLVFAGLLLTMGTLGDHFGRKKALLAGLGLFGTASLGALVVDTSGQLIAVRSLMGVGGALIMPATLSIITNTFPRSERTKAIGIWTAMAAIGIGLGPLFGGLLLEWFSWNSVFLLNVPVAATAFALAIVLVPESRDPRPGAFDLLGAALSIVSLVSLVYALIEAPDKGWTSPLILSAFTAAVIFGAAFVEWELHTKAPMLNLAFFRNPRFSVASGGIGLASFALFGSIFALTQFLQDAHGYSALEAGAAMVPLAFGLVMGSGSSVKLGPRIGTGKIVTAGLVGQSAILVSTLFWSPTMAYWPIGLWFLFVAFFLGWVMAPSTGSVMDAVPPEKAGVASAMNDVTRQVAGALGTAVVGSLITTFYSARMHDHVTTLPHTARTSAESSVGEADAVAATLPHADAASLMSSAAHAFTDALGISLAIAGAVAFLGALAVRHWLPAKPEPASAAGETPLGSTDERRAA
jgi:EmrB/QacA subfamily drug resistance transporter